MSPKLTRMLMLAAILAIAGGAGAQVSSAPVAVDCPAPPLSDSDAALARGLGTEISRVKEAGEVVLETLSEQEAEINAAKSTALSDLTAQVTALHAQRVKSKDLAEQVQLDKQLLTLQEKIDQTSAPLDERLSELKKTKDEVKRSVELRVSRLERQRRGHLPVCEE